MTVGIRLYDFARKEMKLSDEKAKEFVQTMEEYSAHNTDDTVATKLFVKEEISSVKEEIKRVELSFTNAIFWSGLIQFVAIVGSVLAIVNFMIRK